jgi:pantoate--beta-alanine ligase
VKAKACVAVADPLAWKALCARMRAKGSLGFVPTMGALHEGHASLVRRSAAENAHTAVSIFVNPTQFNDPKDLAAYPRTVEKDLEILRAAGADAVFLPESATIYPFGYDYRVAETRLSGLYCGTHRPGHFDGVLTVVMKLLTLTRPERAYFGEKDFQQYLLIRGMARDFFMDSEIIPCPIVREESGLAMSSRNVRLSAAGRAKAALIYRALREFDDPAKARAFLEAEGLTVEYIDDLDIQDGPRQIRRRLAAAWLEGVRLIDNISLPDTPGEEG